MCTTITATVRASIRCVRSTKRTPFKQRKPGRERLWSGFFCVSSNRGFPRGAQPLGPPEAFPRHIFIPFPPTLRRFSLDALQGQTGQDQGQADIG